MAIKPSLLLLTAGLLACSGEGPMGPYNVRLDFDYAYERPSAETIAAPLEAVGEDGGVRLSGHLVSAHTNYRLTAGALRMGKQLRLEIRAEPAGIGLAIPAVFSYAAGIIDLDPGSYDVRIVHRVDGRLESIDFHDVEVH